MQVAELGERGLETMRAHETAHGVRAGVVVLVGIAAGNGLCKLHGRLPMLGAQPRRADQPVIRAQLAPGVRAETLKAVLDVGIFEQPENRPPPFGHFILGEAQLAAQAERRFLERAGQDGAERFVDRRFPRRFQPHRKPQIADQRVRHIKRVELARFLAGDVLRQAQPGKCGRFALQAVLIDALLRVAVVEQRQRILLQQPFGRDGGDTHGENAGHAHVRREPRGFRVREAFARQRKEALVRARHIHIHHHVHHRVRADGHAMPKERKQHVRHLRQLRLMHGDVEQKLIFLKQRVQRLCVIRMHGAETVLNDAPRKPVARRVNDGVPAARVQFLHQRAVNVDEYGVKRRGIEKIGHETAADTSRAPHNQCARHDFYASSNRKRYCASQSAR